MKPEKEINWHLVYAVTSFAMAIIICAYAGAYTALITHKYGLHALLGGWLHPFLAVFSSIFTVWLVQTNPLISLLATTSAALNALLI